MAIFIGNCFSYELRLMRSGFIILNLHRCRPHWQDPHRQSSGLWCSKLSFSNTFLTGFYSIVSPLSYLPDILSNFVCNFLRLECWLNFKGNCLFYLLRDLSVRSLNTVRKVVLLSWLFESTWELLIVIIKLMVRNYVNAILNIFILSNI